MTIYDDKYGKFELTARLVFLLKLMAGQFVSRWPLLTIMSVLKVTVTGKCYEA